MIKRVSKSALQPSRRTSAAKWLSRTVARWLGPAPTSPPEAQPDQSHRRTPPVAPNKAETSLLPPFSGLPPDRIYLPQTQTECHAAAKAILAAGVAGFDTESKPTFQAGEKSTGPHLVQFALTDCAYLFQMRQVECRKTAADLIASERVRKVGFGLGNDHGQIKNRLGVPLRNVLDLDQVFRKRGYKGTIGVRGAMGALLRRNFPKSKATTTSNWAAADLTPRQVAYAANDAYAALKIMEALDPREIPKPPRK